MENNSVGIIIESFDEYMSFKPKISVKTENWFVKNVMTVIYITVFHPIQEHHSKGFLWV